MLLSHWCYCLAGAFAVTGLAALARPAAAAGVCRAFPRGVWAGRVLSAAAWVWAGFAVNMMPLDFLEPCKKFIPALVLVCIPLTWFWLDNLLACRALGGLFTLFPYGLLRAARVHASAWRLAPVVAAYLFIIAGMVLILHPWRGRRALAWLAGGPGRIRPAAAALLAAGALFAVLGATALRG